MDSKFANSKSLQLSGSYLLLFLCLGLSAFAIGLDMTVSHLWPTNISLFVPFTICALVVAATGHWIIPILTRIKAGQFIREDGPQAHLKKAGTPTMGGIFFIPVGIAIALAGSGFDANVMAICALTAAFGLVGFIDDWQILRRKSNKGISAKMKLALQVLFAVLFCIWLAYNQASVASNIALPFGLTLSLGVLFWPLATFVQVAESNATNLTDGVDGLMGGLGAIAFLGMAAYLAPTYPEIALFCACMSGACVGFVSHNRNPAKVFMGDTGALALGGALAGVALITNTLWVLLIISLIFLIETLSVIAQVTYYKATKDANGVGKRLLRMAPIHHHLELSGWSETQVVGCFYCVQGLLIWVVFLIAG
ncbi:MAG: phospho-N-acetylmuramoyl-pentapeptide-transferase [Limnospira sp. PMC 1240.20]|uniref:phospho-N-acetylmuramoyl-pentapeptide- transferase n=1 Tax=unclassified Limnospira TaxID=2642885 RepID=UPI0028E0E787|nr:MULTISPECIES: phospho-N-acetylmuramoyl-pentapeptide-transferase [unclassified Limnospira]MDT9193796.1 phospho-N-acetylmuramoyl-pentapeptide-transferase [Limnospira sp. PMC 1245.20]MDT9219586.1 phospho-N-acetylmuramoyl-pentapeptide-transferase [Limnospira sp. PMC 1240.20]MDT9255336.1 phospho-N-acetylmuramoyl-pentapeptide-transferase [Limnospira sp. PMC 1254.20]MDT9260187.1 phospho-N-acetylmuramoyl-pentapeptide-transferase [Limnospira sp. PMC 1236.20]